MSAVVPGFPHGHLCVIFLHNKEKKLHAFMSSVCVFICVGAHMCPSVHAKVEGRLGFHSEDAIFFSFLEQISHWHGSHQIH